jgi:hypothetical protein
LDELLRTSDIVLIDVVRGLLEADDIPVFVADGQMSALEGGIGAFPRRLLVPRDRMGQARRILVGAGFGAELRDER